MPSEKNSYDLVPSRDKRLMRALDMLDDNPAISMVHNDRRRPEAISASLAARACGNLGAVGEYVRGILAESKSTHKGEENLPSSCESLNTLKGTLRQKAEKREEVTQDELKEFKRCRQDVLNVICGRLGYGPFNRFREKVEEEVPMRSAVEPQKSQCIPPLSTKKEAVTCMSYVSLKENEPSMPNTRMDNLKSNGVAHATQQEIAEF